MITWLEEVVDNILNIESVTDFLLLTKEGRRKNIGKTLSNFVQIFKLFKFLALTTW